MRDYTALRERYLRDGLPTRLGGLAANLARIRRFAARDGGDEVVESLLDESKRFIEWTAGELEIDRAAELVSLQIQLARWQLQWPRIRGTPLARGRMAEEGGIWSQRLLEMSGLLLSSPNSRL
jgi:hypothetical protein